MSHRPQAIAGARTGCCVFAVLIAVPAEWAAAALVAGGLGGLAIRARAPRRRRARAGQLRTGARHLGADAAGRPVILGDRALAAHGLILGASGAGKSTTLLRS